MVFKRNPVGFGKVNKAKKAGYVSKPKVQTKKKVDKEIVKRTQNRITSLVTRGHLHQFFPDRFYTKMKQSQSFNGGVAGGSNLAFGYGGNWIHNSYTGLVTGTVPFSLLNFTTNIAMAGLNLMIGDPSTNKGIYSQYRIHASKMSIKFNNPTNEPFYATLIPQNMGSVGSSNPFGNVSTWSPLTWNEYPYSKTKLISATQNAGTMIKSFMSTAKMYGLKYKSTIESGDYDGGFNFNPPDDSKWAWLLFISADTVGDLYRVEFETEIEYTVEFFGRNVMAPTSI